MIHVKARAMLVMEKDPSGHCLSLLWTCLNMETTGKEDKIFVYIAKNHNMIILNMFMVLPYIFYYFISDDEKGEYEKMCPK